MGSPSCFPFVSYDSVVTEVVMCFHAVCLPSGCMFMYSVVYCYNGHVKSTGEDFTEFNKFIYIWGSGGEGSGAEFTDFNEFIYIWGSGAEGEEGEDFTEFNEFTYIWGSGGEC